MAPFGIIKELCHSWVIQIFAAFTHTPSPQPSEPSWICFLPLSSPTPDLAIPIIDSAALVS